MSPNKLKTKTMKTVKLTKKEIKVFNEIWWYLKECQTSMDVSTITFTEKVIFKTLDEIKLKIN